MWPKNHRLHCMLPRLKPNLHPAVYINYRLKRLSCIFKIAVLTVKFNRNFSNSCWHVWKSMLCGIFTLILSVFVFPTVSTHRSGLKKGRRNINKTLTNWEQVFSSFKVNTFKAPPKPNRKKPMHCFPNLAFNPRHEHTLTDKICIIESYSAKVSKSLNLKNNIK